jgi:hypothetical protein
MLVSSVSGIEQHKTTEQQRTTKTQKINIQNHKSTNRQQQQEHSEVEIYWRRVAVLSAPSSLERMAIVSMSLPCLLFVRYRNDMFVRFVVGCK